MENEKLIELVRSYPVLYDHTHNKYSDHFYKEKLWKEIGMQLNQSSIACKARWNNIRDNYRKSKRKCGVSPDGSNAKNYKYGELLKFLDDYFHDRRPVLKKNKNNKRNDNDDDDRDDNEVDTIEMFTDALDNVHVEEMPSPNEDISESDTEQSRKRPVHTQLIAASKKKYKPSSSVMSSAYDELATIDMESSQDRAVDAFLAGIAPTLKSLNPYYLNLAKSKIFNTVQHYEMEMIIEQSRRTMSPTSLSHLHQEAISADYALNLENS